VNRTRWRGFTLVEVLVALVIVVMGLAALMITVSGTARTSGYLRDKTLAQWIALNRIAEVRLNLNKFAQNTDLGELDFAGRKWHYDTRYFDTSRPPAIPTRSTGPSAPPYPTPHREPTARPLRPRPHRPLQPRPP